MHGVAPWPRLGALSRSAEPGFGSFHRGKDFNLDTYILICQGWFGYLREIGQAIWGAQPVPSMICGMPRSCGALIHLEHEVAHRAPPTKNIYRVLRLYQKSWRGYWKPPGNKCCQRWLSEASPEGFPQVVNRLLTQNTCFRIIGIVH
jgi:hypothetical protein